jgi:hypothetical protein
VMIRVNQRICRSLHIGCLSYGTPTVSAGGESRVDREIQPQIRAVSNQRR